jgi:hypothetical protein
LMKAFTPALIAEMQGAISQRVERLCARLHSAATLSMEITLESYSGLRRPQPRSC